MTRVVQHVALGGVMKRVSGVRARKKVAVKEMPFFQQARPNTTQKPAMRPANPSLAQLKPGMRVHASGTLGA
jgi:hypothetical protein